MRGGGEGERAHVKQDQEQRGLAHSPDVLLHPPRLVVLSGGGVRGEGAGGKGACPFHASAKLLQVAQFCCPTVYLTQKGILLPR